MPFFHNNLSFYLFHGMLFMPLFTQMDDKIYNLLIEFMCFLRANENMYDLYKDSLIDQENEEEEQEIFFRKFFPSDADTNPKYEPEDDDRYSTDDEDDWDDEPEMDETWDAHQMISEFMRLYPELINNTLIMPFSKN